ncbi:MAG TPA: phosphate ABC transporter substrate-binding protein [Candidatus Enterenecus stercoripullorum]|nr:phosphate ABC transporter substrate-binding protein [Candidatus Enterenecus stercoripullorum]
MKKIIAMMMALAMTASLAACGGNGGEESQTPASNDPATSESVAGTETPTELSGTVLCVGSTSMEEVMKTLAEQFGNDNDGVTVNVEGGGSGAGVEAALNGTADLGLASRALKDEEKSQGLVETELALDGIAIIVHPDNPVANLTVEQIAQIYTGEISNWSEVGGSDGEIARIGREASSGTRDGFESITGTDGACQYTEELTSTGTVIEAVRNNPNAIGYASLSAVAEAEGVKAITVGGVECSEATVLDGTYEIQRPFMLITKEGTELSDVAQAFFDWITSPAANDLIAGAGAVPVAE